jgi:hypothetical protein
MRLSTGLIIAVALSSQAVAQIPNAGFENWVTDPDSNRNPVGWETTNSFPVVNVEPIGPGAHGNFAMRVKTVSVGFPFPGVAMLLVGYPFNEPPTKFTATVRSTILPGDRAYLIVGLMKGDSIIAATGDCTFKIDSSYHQFTRLEFRLAIISSLVPDSLVIMVASGLGTGQVGTELIVDDLEFGVGSPTAVLEKATLPGSFALLQNHPNPFNPTTTITFELPHTAEVRLSVSDLLGREVSVLVNERRDAGVYDVPFDAGGLSSGVYLYRLQAGDLVRTRKLIVLR